MGDYFRLIELLLELIGLHPRRPSVDEHVLAAIRAHWRPFVILRVK